MLGTPKPTDPVRIMFRLARFALLAIAVALVLPLPAMAGDEASGVAERLGMDRPLNLSIPPEFRRQEKAFPPVDRGRTEERLPEMSGTESRGFDRAPRLNSAPESLPYGAGFEARTHGSRGAVGGGRGRGR